MSPSRIRGLGGGGDGDGDNPTVGILQCNPVQLKSDWPGSDHRIGLHCNMRTMWIRRERDAEAGIEPSRVPANTVGTSVV
jgi:hypothetical protein